MTVWKRKTADETASRTSGSRTARRRLRTRRVAAVIAVTLAGAVIGPLIVPIPPLQGTVPPRELAGAHSRFVKVNGIEVHYTTSGSGDPPLVLLHGFGASVFSWREVIGPLSRKRQVVAFDRPSAGLTQRPLPGEWDSADYARGSPYSAEAQADLAVGLLDALGLQDAVLVGHSAGGTIALLAAMRHPERVRGLVLIDPAVYTEGGPPVFIAPLLRTPQARRLGPLLVRSLGGRAGDRLLELAWHEPARITDAVRAGYCLPLQAADWDRGLWELVAARRPLRLYERLDEVRCPVLVLSGEDDGIVPVEESRRLSRELPRAEFALIADAGHVPHEEQPQATLDEIERFLEGLSGVPRR